MKTTRSSSQDTGSYPNSMRAWMRYRGFTAQDLEQRTNIPLRTLRTYIAGGFIRHDRRKDLAEALGCSVEQLMEPGARMGKEHLVQYHQTAFSISDDIGSNDMQKTRRDLLRLLTAGGTALLFPLPFSPELDWERINGALTKPAQIDAPALDGLQAINTEYWRAFVTASTKMLVFDGAFGQLKGLVKLLREPHIEPVQRRLCALTSEMSQLVGEIFFDVRDYSLAQSCYSFAVAAAREANHFDLWACALARNAYIPLYDDQTYQDAIPLLQQARRVAQRGDSALPTQFWIDSIAAEAYAGLRTVSACERALESAAGVLSMLPLATPSWLRYEGSRLPALNGSCFVQLERPESAVPALQQALQLVPHAVRRRAMILTDLAQASAQQNEIEQACVYAEEAVAIAVQSSSVMLGEGLRRLRGNLDPFGRTNAVKRLDKRLGQLV